MFCPFPQPALLEMKYWDWKANNLLPDEIGYLSLLAVAVARIPLA